jgi:signal transduction histidine kinase
MSEVSCRVLDVIFDDARKRGIDVADFAKGVNVPLAVLRDKKQRITWPEFSAVLKNIRRHYALEELEVIGGAFTKSPVIKPLAVVASLLFTAGDFYEWAYSPNNPMKSAFACIGSSYIGRERGEAIITLSLKPEFTPSEEFNYISKGALVALPRLVGEPPANVDMEPLTNGVRYVVQYSSRGGQLAFLRKLLTLPFNLFRAGRALKAAHEDLSERYFELDSAKQLVSRQAKQLMTAHTISQMVHADLDVDRTLAAVSNALTRIASYQGVCISLEGAQRREATSGATDGEPSLVMPLEARGLAIGSVALWFGDGTDVEERTALCDIVAPTIAMALHAAVTHDELLDAHAHLERRVEERTAELVAARDALAETIEQLETAQETRARLFANINHEIRTPLTLILLSVDEMRRTRPAEAGRLIAIARNARKLLRLIDGLLLLAAGDEDKLGITPHKTDVGELLRGVVESFAPSARQYQVKLHADIPETLFAEVDEAAVDRIVSNLISNAIKFTPIGGDVYLAGAIAGAELVLTVRDTGVGLGEEFLSRVFGRFEQDARPLRPGSPGSGIGLSIVRSLAEAHMGKASAERQEVGALFRVTLPVVAAPEIRRAADDRALDERPAEPSEFGLPAVVTAPAELARRDHTLLVVEDDEELRAHIVSVLSARYHVHAASSAEEALGMADNVRPDMMVSDVGLPGMNGLELTKRFRELPGNRMAPVLLLTAFATLQDRLSGFEAGAIDYLTKPFEPDELIARVQAQLDRRKLALQLHESEKLAAIGTMSAGLAHEMRNPANGIVNAIEPLAELIPAEARGPGSPVDELLSIIRDCGTQIAVLSRQLLAFRRGDDLTLESIPADKIIDRAVGMLRPLLKTVELKQQLDYKGAVQCSPVLMLQVLGNLLDNAVSAAGSGGWVSVATFVQGDRFVCEIGDSGAGVPPPLRERIFEPFFTTKAPGKGTGLGLSTSREIVVRHDGALYVRPTETASVFRLELPLHAHKQTPRLSA